MPKRNLNEVLGFISRWGESEFSLRLLDEALSSTALETAAKEAEKDNPTGIRAKQLRARSQQRKKREDSLLNVVTDPSTDPDIRKKTIDLINKMKTSAKYEPELEGQKKDTATGEVTVGGKKTQLTKPEEPKKPGELGKFLGVLHPSKAGKRGSLKQLGGEVLSGAGKSLGLVQRALTTGSRAISAGQNLGSMIAEPAGQTNYSVGLTHLGSDIEVIKRALSGGKVPLTGIRHGGRYYSPQNIKDLVKFSQQNQK